MRKKLRQNIMASTGETYTLGVGIVRTKSEDGTPRTIEIICMDEKIDLTNPENREFVTLYLPKIVMRNRQMKQPE